MLKSLSCNKLHNYHQNVSFYICHTYNQFFIEARNRGHEGRGGGFIQLASPQIPPVAMVLFLWRQGRRGTNNTHPILHFIILHISSPWWLWLPPLSHHILHKKIWLQHQLCHHCPNNYILCINVVWSDLLFFMDMALFHHDNFVMWCPWWYDKEGRELFPMAIRVYPKKSTINQSNSENFE